MASSNPSSSSNASRSAAGGSRPAADAAASTLARSSRTEVAASISSVPWSNRQERIASRIDSGTCQSPTAVTNALYFARAAMRASRRGMSDGRATHFRHRSSYVTPVRSSSRSSNARQSTGPATTSSPPAVGWYALVRSAASAQISLRPRSPARLAISRASTSAAA